jgi:diguanylate cyclase (GGDEF)-like protein/PAS domain S-box-containing protein
MQLGVTVRDAQGRIIYCNPAEASLHGYDAAELVGQPAWTLGAPDVRGTWPDAEPRAYDSWQRDSTNVRKSGEVFPVHLRSDVVHDPAGGVMAVVTTCEDATLRKRAEEQQARDALEDALTGLANRAFFLELVDRAGKRLARESDHRFAVLYLDLHRFRLINETLGHEAGDRLLVATAKLFKDAIRPTDVAARIASDEFAILLDGIRALTDATRVAERILERFESPLSVDDKEVYVSPHIGIAVSQTGVGDPQRYLKNANLAMYRARDRGEKRYEVFDVAVHRRATQRLQLETDLRRAIEHDELRAFYQPIVDLKTGAVTGFEALARWAHPQRGMTAPAEFISAAEETGLVVPIGSWMLRAACRQLSAWRRQVPGRPDLSVSVNVSARHLRQPNVVEDVTRALDEAGLAPEHLKLELTETMLMEDADYHVGVLRRLRDARVGVVIDDFGTGYSSLSYLQRFPIHALKIDRSFLANAKQEADWDIVRMIIALARDKGALVVAEGVELEEQAQQLREMGCDLAQGYLYSRPVEPQAAERLLLG